MDTSPQRDKADMATAESIINYEKDPKEDYYGIVGCDQSSSAEQILAEFKVRAKQLHPDKNDDPACEEKFKLLHTAKSVLAEPSERKRYDLWLDSGIAMSFRHWQGLKDAVHTSMHWATPKLAGRMLSNGENQSAKDDELSEEEVLQHLRRLEEAGGEPLQREEEETNTKSHEKAAEGEDEDARAEDPEADEDDGNADEVAEDEISFPPTNFTELGLRVESPDPEWGWDRPEEELRAERLERYNAVREEDKGKDDGIPKINESVIGARGKATANKLLRRASVLFEPKPSSSSSSSSGAASTRRQQFAERQDSSVNAMMLLDPIDDNEMRRRFRNYEI